MEAEDPMSYFEAAIVTMFGVILPTGDVGSDYWLAGALFFMDDLSCRYEPEVHNALIRKY